MVQVLSRRANLPVGAVSHLVVVEGGVDEVLVACTVEEGGDSEEVAEVRNVFIQYRISFQYPTLQNSLCKIKLLCKLFTYDSYIREVFVALRKKCLACEGSLSYNHEINDWDISFA